MEFIADTQQLLGIMTYSILYEWFQKPEKQLHDSHSGVISFEPTRNN